MFSRKYGTGTQKRSLKAEPREKIRKRLELAVAAIWVWTRLVAVEMEGRRWFGEI